MPDDGLFSFEKFVAESLDILLRRIGETSERLTFRVVRQSDEELPLSPQDKSDILNLYGSMLQNPKIKRQNADFDPVSEVECYLHKFHDPLEDQNSSEQIFVLANYKGHIVSYLHGSLRGSTFFLWYLIGPRNLCYSKLNEDIELPKEIESMRFSEALTLKLLGCLCGQGDVSQLVYAISTQGLQDPKCTERSRLKLFIGLEDRIISMAKSPLRRTMSSTLKRVNRSYLIEDNFIQPMINQDSVKNRNYVLVCVPLNQEVSAMFKGGSIPYTYYRSMLESIYPVFYEFHEPDELVAIKAKQSIESLLDEKDRVFGKGTVGVIPLSEGVQRRLPK